MTGLRFNVGDLARVVSASRPEDFDTIGIIVEILTVGPYRVGDAIALPWGEEDCEENCDYACAEPRNKWGEYRDCELAPIDPPTEPTSLTRRTHHEEPATA